MFQGSGTGVVTYEIVKQNPVENCCAVDVLETDSAELLTLQLRFTDPTLGQVQVGISVLNYDPTSSEFTNNLYLMIGMAVQNPEGVWASNSGSSLSLYVTQATVESGRTYQGSFNASNLTWLGAGQEDSLAIKFGAFNLSVTEILPPIFPSSAAGSGTGSMTYTLDGAASQTETVTPNFVETYSAGALTSLRLVVTWSDPLKGDMEFVLQVNGFTGSGTYSPALQVTIDSVSQTMSWKNGSASSVTFNAQYTMTINGPNLQGSLDATALVFPDNSQPDLDLNATTIDLSLWFD